MRAVKRLLSYGSRYWEHLLASVVLMALAGAAQGALALLIRPIFDRVLVSNPPKGLTPLLQHPIWGRQIYLEQLKRRVEGGTSSP